MFSVSVLVLIPMLLVLNALDNCIQRQRRKKEEEKRIEKFEDMEKEMRKKGIDESTITMAKFFYTD